MAIDDAPLAEDALARVLPLDGRFPEPRVLWQDEVFYLRDRRRLVLGDLGEDGVGWVLEYLLALASDLHEVACEDEALTTSSGLRRALAAVGVPLVAEIDPLVWVESTVLVRSLRRRLP